MTTQQIADRLVELCRQGQFNEAYQELFSSEARAIEPDYDFVPVKETQGLEALLAKSKIFEQMAESLHSVSVSDALVSGNFFTVKMAMDITIKGREREIMEELCMYQVQDGKIIQEQFFY